MRASADPARQVLKFSSPAVPPRMHSETPRVLVFPWRSLLAAFSSGGQNDDGLFFTGLLAQGLHLMKDDGFTEENGEPRKRKRVKLFDDEVPVKVTNKYAEPGTPLSAAELRFVQVYVQDYNLFEAGMAYGASPTRAHHIGRKLRRQANISRAIKQIESDRIRRIQFDGDEFIARDLAIAKVDLTELARLHIPPCRHCWGINNNYQRTHAEFEKDFEDYNQGHGQTKTIKGRLGLPTQVSVPFDPKGGSGYNIWSDPNPGCPNCFGNGEFNENGNQPVILHKSHEDLPPELRQMIAGVKVTKDGVQTLLRSKEDAINRLHNLVKTSLEFGVKPGQGSVITLRQSDYGQSGPRQITKVIRRIIDASGNELDGSDDRYGGVLPSITPAEEV